MSRCVDKLRLPIGITYHTLTFTRRGLNPLRVKADTI